MSSLVGRPCPEFAAEDVQQREFRPSDYRGPANTLIRSFLDIEPSIKAHLIPSAVRRLLISCISRRNWQKMSFLFPEARLARTWATTAAILLLVGGLTTGEAAKSKSTRCPRRMRRSVARSGITHTWRISINMGKGDVSSPKR